MNKGNATMLNNRLNNGPDQVADEEQPLLQNKTEEEKLSFVTQTH